MQLKYVIFKKCFYFSAIFGIITVYVYKGWRLSVMENLKIMPGDARLLGVTRTDKGYNFAICCDYESITLELYKHGDELPKHKIVLDRDNRVGSVFCVLLSGIDFESYEYLYDISGVKYTDPYTRYITNGKAFGEERDDEPYRSGIVCEDYDWEGDHAIRRPLSDTLIYKLHVRGFTKNPSSKVRCKGEFEGVMEKLDYIESLGFNAIMLMPSYEFDEFTKGGTVNIYAAIDEKKVNYWGYTKGLYMAPKYAYSKSVLGKKSYDYTVAFKNLVKECHKRGIEIYTEMYFDTGCNQSFINDCVKFWVMEYHIDGVNLCMDAGIARQVADDPILSHTKLFCNYWADDFHKKYGSLDRTLADYNDGFLKSARCFLKGDSDALRDYIYHFKFNPSKGGNINYITNHNTLTMYDMVCYERKHNEANGERNIDGSDYNYSWNCGVEGKSRKKKINQLRLRQVKNALALLMLSQGTPLIMAGDEFLNSTDGNNNPYCQDNSISYIDWKNMNSNAELIDYVRKLIEFRIKNPILHSKNELRGSDYLSCGFPDISIHSESAWYPKLENYNRHAGILLCNEYCESEGLIYIAYNMHWEDHDLALPKISSKRGFEVVIKTCEEDIVPDKSVKIPARSIAVLIAH